MTTPIKIGPANKQIRIALEHENNRNLEIIHVHEGETRTFYVHSGTRIVAIEEVHGRTHLSRLAATPAST